MCTDALKLSVLRNILHENLSGVVVAQRVAQFMNWSQGQWFDN